MVALSAFAHYSPNPLSERISMEISLENGASQARCRFGSAAKTRARGSARVYRLEVGIFPRFSARGVRATGTLSSYEKTEFGKKVKAAGRAPVAESTSNASCCKSKMVWPNVRDC